MASDENKDLKSNLNPNLDTTSCPINSSIGKFIVIEGGDSAGKHTQAKLLLKHITKSFPACEMELLSFPQYDTPFGELVAKYLRGEFGTLDHVPPEIACMLYALDRYQVKDKLKSDLEAGKWLIADRYTQSNFGHQGAKLDGDARNELIAWVEGLESRLPQPDLVLYLYVPAKVTQKLMEAREHKSYLASDKHQDIHEQDVTYQERVIETYIAIANSRTNWEVIDCVNKQTGELYSIEKIHRKIVQIVTQRLGPIQ